jgi:flagellar hook assembly protein FlgD
VAFESLLVFFRLDDSSLTDTVRGVSPRLVWEDPEIISRLVMYPSPVNFNLGQVVKIYYALKFKSDVTIKIVSAEGSLVFGKTYSKGTANGGQKGFNTVVWDGKNRNGKNVGSGAYIVKILVDSPEGQVVNTKKIGVIGRK